ncbi:UMP kinase [Thiospirillum jenense]|uniref:Uridylate kinase n=1 Tax=Thiospirillum jenense TaxID=1653858 RepID=A0A839HKQ2_9GAMM|nr:UMP kinase [Thiospirillum jenense]MBB1126392.1 UMP kinase [Thiospirillum jenense]
MTTPQYRRILLKLSGEALLGGQSHGIDPQLLTRLAQEIADLTAQRMQVAVVIGGGNLFRGAGLAAAGMNRVTADHMGMLATVMNALAMQDALEQCGVAARVLSALRMEQVCEEYTARGAVRHLERGRVTLFAAGTGNPFFTTDSAASLRAAEIRADLLIKATKVDGIYAADPKVQPDAHFYSQLTYAQVLRDNLQVMDTTAVVLCRDHHIPVRVLNIYQPGALARVIAGEAIGSLITA